MASYKFGQFRRNQVTDYTKPLECTVDEIRTTDAFSQVREFKDTVLTLEGNNILHSVDSTRTKSRSYYLKYKVYKQSEEQVITLRLFNTDKSTDNIQALETITVPQGNEDEFFSFDLVISPNADYNQIQFILNRQSIDMQENPDGTYGRTTKIEVEYYEEIINVIDTYLAGPTNNAGILKQIGVQGPPGMLMCIQGEAIRVGRSGIYEINNGVVISFLGFVVHKDEPNYFFLDYQY